MSTMHILRGPSGIGKSTYVEDLRVDVIASADDWFVNREFNPRQLTHAHTACFRKALDACACGAPLAVDNTNINLWELWPYVMLGRAHQYQIEIVNFVPAVPSDEVVQLLARLNRHGVPETAIAAQLNGLARPLPKASLADVRVKQVVVPVLELRLRLAARVENR